MTEPTVVKTAVYPQEILLLRRLERQLSAHFNQPDLGHLAKAHATLVELHEWRGQRPGEAGARGAQGGTLA